MKSLFNSNNITVILFILFIIALLVIPFRGGIEMFTLGKWENNIRDPAAEAGFCGPDFSQFSDKDNVAVRCVGNGTMTSEDCCRLRNMGQVCGVNLDNWEAYECKYYSGKACERCKTQNAQY